MIRAALLAMTALLCCSSTTLTVQGKRLRGSTGHRLSVPGEPPTPATFCGYLEAADRVGNWSCTNGDGSSAAGSVFAIAPVNAPQVVNYMGYSQLRLNPTGVADDQYLRSPTQAPPSGAFSACLLATKKEIVTADWVSFSDHAGAFSTLVEDNSITITSYASGGFPTAPIEPSEGAYAEALVCIVFSPGLTIGTCVISSTNVPADTGSCNTTATAVTALPAGNLRWIFGGAENGTAYNMRGFARGAFLTEKALTLTDLKRIGSSVIASPPAGAALWVDAANMDGLGNSTVTNGATLNNWVSLGSMANPDAGSADFVAVSSDGTPHALTSGQKVVSYDGVYDQSIAAGSKTSLAFVNSGTFDTFLTIRKRNTSIAGERRLFGSCEGQKGLFVGLNDYSNTEGTFWVIVGNGAALRSNYRTTLAAPLGEVFSLLVRGDGTNLKVSSGNFTSFETSAFANSAVAGDSFYDWGVGAINPADAVGTQFTDGDYMQALAYNRNLSDIELVQVSNYLRARAPPVTQRVWAALGDSLTLGATGAYPWPARLTAALGPRTSVANQGKSGDTAAAAGTRYTNSIAGEGFYGLIVLLGINDITADATGAATWTDTNVTITAALAAGMPVVLLTNFPFGAAADWTAPRQVQLQALIDLQKARAGVTVVDTNQLLWDPSNHQNLLPAYSYDGKHINDLGTAAVAAALEPVLAGL